MVIEPHCSRSVLFHIPFAFHLRRSVEPFPERKMYERFDEDLMKRIDDMNDQQEQLRNDPGPLGRLARQLGKRKVCFAWNLCSTCSLRACSPDPLPLFSMLLIAMHARLGSAHEICTIQ